MIPHGIDKKGSIFMALPTHLFPFSAILRMMLCFCVDSVCMFLSVHFEVISGPRS